MALFRRSTRSIRCLSSHYLQAVSLNSSISSSSKRSLMSQVAKDNASSTGSVVHEEIKIKEGLNGYKYDKSGALFGSSHCRVLEGSKTAFEYLLSSHNYVETARNWPGNVFFHMTQDVADPLTYRWFEKWENYNSVASFVYQFSFPKLFNTDEMKLILENGKITVDGTYTELLNDNNSESNPERASETIKIDINSKACDIWKIMGDFSSVLMIPGVIKIENNIDNNPMIRKVYFDPNNDVLKGKVLTGRLLVYDQSEAPYKYKYKYSYDETEETMELILKQNNDGKTSTILGTYNVGKKWPLGVYNENAFTEAKAVLTERIPAYYKKLFENQK